MLKLFRRLVRMQAEVLAEAGWYTLQRFGRRMQVRFDRVLLVHTERAAVRIERGLGRIVPVAVGRIELVVAVRIVLDLAHTELGLVLAHHFGYTDPGLVRIVLVPGLVRIVFDPDLERTDLVLDLEYFVLEHIVLDPVEFADLVLERIGLLPDRHPEHIDSVLEHTGFVDSVPARHPEDTAPDHHSRDYPHPDSLHSKVGSGYLYNTVPRNSPTFVRFPLARFSQSGLVVGDPTTRSIIRNLDYLPARSFYRPSEYLR